MPVAQPGRTAATAAVVIAQRKAVIMLNLPLEGAEDAGLARRRQPDALGAMGENEAELVRFALAQAPAVTRC